MLLITTNGSYFLTLCIFISIWYMLILFKSMQKLNKCKVLSAMDYVTDYSEFQLWSQCLSTGGSEESTVPGRRCWALFRWRWRWGGRWQHPPNSRSPARYYCGPDRDWCTRRPKPCSSYCAWCCQTHTYCTVQPTGVRLYRIVVLTMCDAKAIQNTVRWNLD